MNQYNNKMPQQMTDDFNNHLKDSQVKKLLQNDNPQQDP